MMIEKAIAAALEPIADVIAALDARLKALEIPAQIEFPIDDVAAALKADPEFCDGVRGKDAEPLTPVAVASILDPLVGRVAVLEPIAERIAAIEAQLQAMDAPAEIEVPIDDVAAALKADPEFCESVRGPAGEPVHVDPAIVAKELAAIIPLPRNGVNGIGHDVKEWAPGIYREGDTVQHDMGRIARAVRDTAEQPGTGDDWERVGKSGFRWRGVKDETKTYQDGDFFIDDGTTFLVCEGKPRMFCRKGRDGKAASDGVNGKDASALIGELKIWPGVDAPDGYLLADGAAVPAGAEYDALRAIVGDTVPDFSSEFLISESARGPCVATFIVRAFLS